MPRRIPDYALQFADFNVISSIGGFMFGASFILFTYIIVNCIRNGKPASARPWESAKGLEWTLAPKAQYHSFRTEPNYQDIIKNHNIYMMNKQNKGVLTAVIVALVAVSIYSATIILNS